MKKNILLFIIDSLNYSHVKDSDKLMPFLQKLKKNGIYCNNMYSQAPYTEAAIMNIYCGQNVLDNSGYLKRFKDAPANIFEEMQKCGYKTYFNSYQSQCYPSSVRRGVDCIYYNVGYDAGALWSYRLYHFADLYKKGKLNDSDYDLLCEIMDDNFKEWLRFVEDIIKKDESTNMIYGNCSNYNSENVKIMVSTQYSVYQSDKKAYLNNMFTYGKEHPFFKIPSYRQNLKAKDRNEMKIISDYMQPTFLRIKEMNKRLNLKNEKHILRGPFQKALELIKHPSNESLKDFGKSYMLSKDFVFDTDLMSRCTKNYDCFKNAPSAKNHIDHYINWASNNTDTPHFACIHIDDIHNPEEFFTYDSDDISLIKEEFEAVNKYLDTVPDTYHGSLTHDLSLIYIDNKIKYLYEALQNKELLDNTQILICADHGFSFSGNPLRDSFVINFYLENYNIPCVLTGAGNKGEIKGLYASKDIPATLLKLAGGTIPEGFTGRSFIDDKPYDLLDIEYCGGGCPDLTRRQLKIAAFNKELFVGSLEELNNEFTKKSIKEVYDLSKDPLQKKNIVRKAKKYDIEKFANQIQLRRDEIKRTQK